MYRMPDEKRELSGLEAKLALLRERLVAGLPERAAGIRAATDSIVAGAPDGREELRRAAHKLRGVAATYGLDDLTRRAARVEEGVIRGETDETIVEAARALLAAIAAAK
jgi:HPt (histidine-containing phosphotransfer) domain-containing protein